MCAEKSGSAPNVLVSVITNKCPRCREGKLFTHSNPYDFKTTMRMPERCPVCGQAYELHTGFYFGTGYVSFAISVALLFAIFTAWAVLAGFSYRDNSVYWCLGFSTVFLLATQPLIQRLSRSMWISFFVRYDKNWQKPEHNK